ncbi:hypothetical protein GCM10027280_08540 [Micromonospora polyrhachis]|uniref:Lantibiotic dehydratase N-terminal domain-containing protein n=1 Tax=Micromonospora polyrhachis TaxID=1282883 RepID=A0A7W7SPP9_9ACTN|nr:lantibiotic dehydratase [Micromonospora polyrhachis]MBB4958286.1 hypothetical protein [Micromonospora polyrhachis]
MTTPTVTTAPILGGSVLLRMAGLPLSALAQGGDPQLATRLAEWDRDTAIYQERARQVAKQLGDLLVPHPGLHRAQRGTALRVRRALHRGDPVPASSTGLADLAVELLPDSGLAEALRETHAAADALRHAGHAIEGSVAAEEARLLDLPWRILHEHPAGRHTLRHGDVAIFEEISRRVVRGEPWTTKRMRQRSEYLWRMLTRGSARATPRGWLAHVGPLPVSETGATGWLAGKAIVVRDLAATEIVDNLDEFRKLRATSATVLADDGETVAIAPLSWQDVGQVAVWLVDTEQHGHGEQPEHGKQHSHGEQPEHGKRHSRDKQRSRLVAVRLRRSAVLDAVWSLLDSGPRPVVRLVDALAGRDPDRRDALRRFLAHLVEVGALQLGAAPQPRYTGWQPVAAFQLPANPNQLPANPDLAAAPAFVDVYRQPAGDLGRAYASELSELIGQALRVMALAGSDSPATPPALPRALTEKPRRLLDVVAECVEEDDSGFSGHGDHRHDWPVPRDADSGYARLFRWIDARLPNGAARVDGDGIDLGPATLDRCGAPEQPVDWPVDVLLRPIASRTVSDHSRPVTPVADRSRPVPAIPDHSGPVALLADLAPAGVLDARFLPALRHLGADLPHAEAYRRFLNRLDDLTDVPFVELLIPPMSTMAANAVRRPGYTRLWTGDPDQTGYFPDGARRPTTYLPLSAITLRVTDGRVIAEAEGRQIWPVMHTARVPRPPWDVIRALLLGASPQTDRRAWRPLTHSLPAWPDRNYVPRITVGGGRLVLTPAQWRISRADAGHPDEPLVDRMRTLVRLRHRLDLPRWVTVVTSPHDEPTTVDLESVRAPRVLDRLPAGHPALLVSELLPAPDQLPVRDEATPVDGGSLAELIFRVPFDTTADAAAGLVAARIHRPPGPSPEAPPDRPVPTENPPPDQRMVPHGPVRNR